MPNYLEYQKSISDEFKALENRVRNLIDSANWAEEGRYKEIILMNYLKRVLPKNLSVGTGFVRNGDITTQIDIIIYENTYPLLFSEGDFIVASAENVKGIIEVKTRIRHFDLIDIINKANENGQIIIGESDRSIFNGIFSYNTECSSSIFEEFERNSLYSSVVRRHFNEIHPKFFDCCVNHVALDNRMFIKQWTNDKIEEFKYPYYSLYDLNDNLAYGYFISNLINYLRLERPGTLTEKEEEKLQKFYYPIIEGKESRWVADYCFDTLKVDYGGREN